MSGSSQSQDAENVATPQGSTIPVRRISVYTPSDPCELAVHAHRDAVSRFLVEHRTWQRPIASFLWSHMRPGDVFVDVGAHIGYFSLMGWTAMQPQGQVICFEPDARNRAVLEANLKRHNVPCTIYPSAVADRAGTAVLYCYPDHGHHSLIAADSPGRAQQCEVDVTTLTDALAEVPRVRCIKIDVQGAEWRVLQGAEGLLQRLGTGRPAIIFEMAPAKWILDDPGCAGLRAFVERHRYRLHAFIATEALKARPPRIEWETLMALARDLATDSPHSELDVLLFPIK